MAGNTSSVTAQILGDASGAKQAFAEAQDAIKKTGVTTEEANKQIADSELGVEMAQKSRLSVSKQIELAVAAEKAKGDELGAELVQLEREYAILVKQMEVMARYGKEIPQTMVQQAAAARSAADAIREKTESDTQSANIADEVAKKLDSQGMALKVIKLAYNETKVAVSNFVTSLVEASTPLDKLGREATFSEKAFAGIKQVWNDPEWKNQPDHIKALATAWAAFNPDIAEAIAKIETYNRQISRRQDLEKGINAIIDEETRLTKENLARGEEAAKKLAGFKKEQYDNETKNRSQDQKKSLAEEQAEDEKAAQAQADASFSIYKEGLKKEEEAKRGHDKWMSDADKFINGQKEKWAKEDAENEAELSKKVRDAKKKDLEESTKQWAAMGSAIADAGASAFESWVDNSSSGSEAAKSATRSIGKSVIQAAAAKASAEAMAAYSGIPFVGIAMGITAAATVATMILSYLTKFHQGGTVNASDGARLPGMASNERAITVEVGETITTNKRGVRSSGASVHYHNHNHGPFSPSSADTKRQAREHGKVMSRMAKRGYPWGK